MYAGVPVNAAAKMLAAYESKMFDQTPWLREGLR